MGRSEPLGALVGLRLGVGALTLILLLSVGLLAPSATAANAPPPWLASSRSG